MKLHLLLIALLSLALPSAAQNAPDAETRFHDAYLAEVIEGKTAEAAKVYYELMEAGGVSDRIRRESRFRFAVCCVLLGRADEGRARLAELAAEPGLPAAMKARVAEYREALEGIGAGSEVDKRLEELVFELGRTSFTESHKLYRDFQIIGKSAVPFLKRLLSHSDESIRLHAFRILCLLDVPGLAEIWDPRWSERATSQHFGPYLKQHPEAIRRVEARLLELEGEAFAEAMERNDGLLPAARPISEEFLDALANRPGHERMAIDLYEWWSRSDSDLLHEWLESENPALSVPVARLLTVVHQSEERDDRMEPALLPIIVEKLLGEELTWRDWVEPPNTRPVRNLRAAGTYPVPDSKAGLTRYALRNRAATVQGILAKLVELGESWEGEPWTNPLFTGLADALADSLDARDSKEIDLPSYLALLKRWISVHTSIDPGKWKGRRMYRGWPDPDFQSHLACVLAHSPAEEAKRLIRWMLSGPRGREDPYAQGFKVETQRDLEFLRTAWDVLRENEGAGESRRILLLQLPIFRGPEETPPDLVEPQAELLAGLLGTLGPGNNTSVSPLLWKELDKLPAEAGRRILLKAVTSISRRPERMRSTYLQDLFARSSRSGRSTTRYRREIAVPALSQVWEVVDGEQHEELMDFALVFLKDDYERKTVLDDALPALGRFIWEHNDSLKQYHFSLLARYPNLFPPKDWIPIAPAAVWERGDASGYIVGDGLAASIAHELILEPNRVNASVIAFIRTCVTPDKVRRQVEEELLRTGTPAAIRELAVSLQAKKREISATQLEKTLASLLEQKDAPLETITELARVLVEVQPSEKLFPAVRRMLASDVLHELRSGVWIATKLGRMDLVGDLAKLLDSMDQGVRDLAKGAIDSILELKRLREEAKARSMEGDE